MKKLNIYFGHSRDFDYEKELYEPIRNSLLNQKHNIIFPHEKGKSIFNSKEDLKKVDLMIAEVSYPSTGLGIELGFAHLYNLRVVCVYKKDFKISSSLKMCFTEFIEYENPQDLIEKVQKII